MTRPLSDNPAAVRMRRHRERERLSVRLVVIEVSPDLVSDLIDIGALIPSEIEDPEALRRAILDIAARAVEEAKIGRHAQRGGAGAANSARCSRARDRACPM